MTDKVQKIREEVVRKLDVMQYQVHRKDAYKELKGILAYIDEMQKEPISEDLEKASYYFACKCHPLKTEYSTSSPNPEVIMAFKGGANWQKEQMMAKAIDSRCFGFQGDALFSFKLPADNYLVGSEVKVIVIKED